jgi:hypothetical protein
MSPLNQAAKIKIHSQKNRFKSEMFWKGGMNFTYNLFEFFFIN